MDELFGSSACTWEAGTGSFSPTVSWWLSLVSLLPVDKMWGNDTTKVYTLWARDQESYIHFKAEIDRLSSTSRIER